MPRSRPSLKDNLILEAAVDLTRERWFPDLPKIKARIAGPEDVDLGHVSAWYDDGVVINPMFLEKASSEELKEAIRHELVHAWVAHYYPDEFNDEETNGHGERFIKKAIEIDLDLRSTIWTYSKSKLIYERLTKRNIDIIAQTRYILVKPDPPKSVSISQAPTFSDVNRKFLRGLVAADLLPFWGMAALLGCSLFLFHAEMNQVTFGGIWVVMLICIVYGWGIFRSKFWR